MDDGIDGSDGRAAITVPAFEPITMVGQRPDKPHQSVLKPGILQRGVITGPVLAAKAFLKGQGPVPVDLKEAIPVDKPIRAGQVLDVMDDHAVVALNVTSESCWQLYVQAATVGVSGSVTLAVMS